MKPVLCVVCNGNRMITRVTNLQGMQQIECPNCKGKGWVYEAIEEPIISNEVLIVEVKPEEIQPQEIVSQPIAKKLGRPKRI